MKVETLGGAAIAAIILFITGTTALITQEGIESFSQIGQIPWAVLALGSAASFLKDYQALSTRRVIGNLTGGGA